MMQLLSMFQSTHPCGVRRAVFTTPKPLAMFQSTHPCGVRRGVVCRLVSLGVSIHAPVWGATFFTFNINFFHSFNPRTRVGCDIPFFTLSLPSVVSIHAPVWGATQICAVRICPYLVSIHAPVWGATKQVRRLLSKH